MSMVIHTNAPSLQAQRHLNRTNSAMKSNIAKLSSGFRINSAADDAAGLAISEDMKIDIRSLSQASRNANDAVSLLQTAEGALGETSNILGRMRELSVQANSDILSADQRDYLNEEFSQLQGELDRIATTTEFNGTSLLDGTIATGSGLDIQVGTAATDTHTIEIEDMTAATLGVDAGTISLDSTGDPAAAMGAIDTAISTVLEQRSNLGAQQNRMNYTIQNLDVTNENLSAANSRIRDVDVASEMASFTKNQILMQAGTAMLSQANSMPQSALSLLG